MQSHKLRITAGIVAVTALVLIFLFQRIDLAGYLGAEQTITRFLINRTIRFILNDVFAILLIYALFEQRKYVLFAFYVQMAGMVLILFPYFLLKLQYPSYNGPLISFLHRLVLNPTLMLLLIPAFYFQKRKAWGNSKV